MRTVFTNRGFVALLVTQFFGAANDNTLKGVLSFAVAASGLWAASLGAGGQAYVGLCLTIPFILFSGIAGQIADLLSKRSVTIVVKIFEVGIAVIALVGFWTRSLPITLGAMVLLATQSAFFGPAKYGMIPEIVPSRDLSRANGAINMLTNIAIILGTLAAGPLYDWYYPPSNPAPAAGALPDPLLWAPGVALVGFAVVGCLASFFLPRLAAQSPDLSFNFNPFGPYWAAIREMAGSRLLAVALAWSFFYMIGMIAILILPDYKALLNIDAVWASYLLGILGVAIGIGSITAGWISGDDIEPRLIPVGAVGMTVFFLALGLVPDNYYLIAGLLLGAGIFAGFYIIPLQALLQYLSPVDERGRFLGTANAISFLFSSIGSLIFLLARKGFGMPANRIFLICAAMALVGTAFLLLIRRKTMDDTLA